MTGHELIDLQGISKVFFTEEMETSALDNIYLSIGKGEYVSISGPSGCGKSTLLSVMGLLNSSTEGKYSQRPGSDRSHSGTAGQGPE